VSSFPSDRPTSGRRWIRPLLLLAIFGLAAAAAAGAWYLFGRPAAPAEVGLGAVPTATATTSAVPDGSASSLASPSGTGPGASEPAAGSLDGTWSVDGSIGSFDDFTGSFVGYRVQEELVGIGGATAVGRTPDVSGNLIFAGTAVTAVEISADLTTLQSDSSMRDGQLSRQGLETDQFPTATFVLATPVELAGAPVEGETFTATATGDLTLHGVTNRVELELDVRLQGGIVTIVGSLPIAFGDYGMTAPESMRVLSIDENGTMEFQLHFVKT
jgi:polyisoprenoid-binding protein YceI